MGTPIKATLTGTLNPNGSITNATISPAMDEVAPLVLVCPPSLQSLLQQIDKEEVQADSSKVARLKDKGGSSYYSTQIKAIQKEPRNKTPEPHGVKGNWSSKCQDDLLRATQQG